MYEYRWYQWLLFFYIYCFAGWIFESAYVSIKERRLVNRGFLRLPLLPLYGTGAVMMLLVSLPIQDHLVLVYIAGVGAATLLEYVTGWAMEGLFKVRYWDFFCNQSALIIIVMVELLGLQSKEYLIARQIKWSAVRPMNQHRDCQGLTTTNVIKGSYSDFSWHFNTPFMVRFRRYLAAPQSCQSRLSPCHPYL